MNKSISYDICGVGHLHDLLWLQEIAFEFISDTSWLRRNSEEMFRECLCPPHVTIGAFSQEQLIAFAIYYNPIIHKEEALSPYLTSIDGQSYQSANYKLCIVHPDYRGVHLQQKLGAMLETYALQQGITMLCSTASPNNCYSIHNLLSLGYQLDHTFVKYHFPRNLYYKIL